MHVATATLAIMQYAMHALFTFFLKDYDSDLRSFQSEFKINKFLKVNQKSM